MVSNRQAFEIGYCTAYLACTRFYKETKTLGQRVQAHREILEVVYRHPALSLLHGFMDMLMLGGRGILTVLRPVGNTIFIFARNRFGSGEIFAL